MDSDLDYLITKIKVWSREEVMHAFHKIQNIHVQKVYFAGLSHWTDTCQQFKVLVKEKIYFSVCLAHIQQFRDKEGLVSY